METKYIQRVNNKKLMKEEDNKVKEFTKGVELFKEEIEPTLPQEERRSVEEWLIDLKKARDELKDQLANNRDYQEYLKNRQPRKTIQPIKRVEK